MKPRLRATTVSIVDRALRALRDDGVPHLLIYDPDERRYTVSSDLPDGCEDWSMAHWVACRLSEEQERAGHEDGKPYTPEPERPVQAANVKREP